MFELDHSMYESVRPLFQDVPYFKPAIYSVIEESQPGRIFADHPREPRSGLVWGNTWYLGGEASNPDFNQEIKNFFVRELMPKSEHALIFSFTDEWQSMLDELFKDLDVRRIYRTIFTFDMALFRSQHAAWREHIPDGFQLQRIDRSMAGKVGGIPELWGSIDAFMQRGFGYGLLHAGEMVSSCQTVFVGDRRAETGIGTHEEFRRRGLATLAACAYLDHCLDQDIWPEWGCMYNPASEALAQKLGYTNRQDYPLHYIHTKQL